MCVRPCCRGDCCQVAKFADDEPIFDEEEASEDDSEAAADGDAVDGDDADVVEEVFGDRGFDADLDVVAYPSARVEGAAPKRAKSAPKAFAI